jgi:hypothetical protein
MQPICWWGFHLKDAGLLPISTPALPRLSGTKNVMTKEEVLLIDA